MKYQVQIPQIHCSGCINLIKLTLEEKFTDIEVDENTKLVVFESNNDEKATIVLLNEFFKTELEPAGYKYFDLKIINT